MHEYCKHPAKQVQVKTTYSWLREHIYYWNGILSKGYCSIFELGFRVLQILGGKKHQRWTLVPQRMAHLTVHPMATCDFFLQHTDQLFGFVRDNENSQWCDVMWLYCVRVYTKGGFFFLKSLNQEEGCFPSAALCSPATVQELKAGFPWSGMLFLFNDKYLFNSNSNTLKYSATLGKLFWNKRKTWLVSKSCSLKWICDKFLDTRCLKMSSTFWVRWVYLSPAAPTLKTHVGTVCRLEFSFSTILVPLNVPFFYWCDTWYQLNTMKSTESWHQEAKSKPVSCRWSVNHQPWQTDLSAGCRLDEPLIDPFSFPGKVIRWGGLEVFAFQPELNVFIAELWSQERLESFQISWVKDLKKSWLLTLNHHMFFVVCK